jgi:hypothetical protein
MICWFSVDTRASRQTRNTLIGCFVTVYVLPCRSIPEVLTAFEVIVVILIPERVIKTALRVITGSSEALRGLYHGLDPFRVIDYSARLKVNAALCQCCAQHLDSARTLWSWSR